MLSTFKTTVLSLVRDHALLVWTLLFPIIMSMVFGLMFSSLQEQDSYAFDTVHLGIIRDIDFDAAPGLDQMLDAVSAEDAQTRYFELTDCADVDEATRLTNDGTIDGYLTVSSDGTPELHLATRMNGTYAASISKAVMDSYVRTAAEYKEAISQRPELAADPQALAVFSTSAVSTTQLSVTRTAPQSSMRYYYALLGMAAGMAAMIAAEAVRRCQATTSPVGARRVMGGIPRWKVLVATMGASWACSMACLVVAFCFMRFVIGVDFGGREGWCLVALVLSAAMATCVGAFLGTFVRLHAGIISGLTCLLSIFSGLYGPGVQTLSDTVARTFPWLSAMNPLWQISHAFFSLLYYDSLRPFAASCLGLVAISVPFLVLAVIRMRRQRYEHL
ncbi:MAG: ABC transporter permease [Atopobiaceae bacterium]|nr:ABC transporter permease [Atopobiaceae bacterium]MCI2172724.1 ABC transporter permease [Atopobiaceae bacterium]